jgi:hypothetical protein
LSTSTASNSVGNGGVVAVRVAAAAADIPVAATRPLASHNNTAICNRLIVLCNGNATINREQCMHKRRTTTTRKETERTESLNEGETVNLKQLVGRESAYSSLYAMVDSSNTRYSSSMRGKRGIKRRREQARGLYQCWLVQNK